jgi:hypothetical protein
MHATILTSSCDPNKLDKDSISKTYVFSTNWGFKFGLPIDYYICSTVENLLLDSIVSSKFSPKKWLITENVSKHLEKTRISQPFKKEDLFRRLRSISDLGRKHILPFKERGGLNLPTSGAQLIYLVSSFDFKKVDILGINLYTQRVRGNDYKFFGNTSSENPYQLSGKPHDFGTDFEFIYESFIRMIKNGTLIYTDSDILSDLLIQIESGIQKENIKNSLLKKYYLEE